MSDVDGSRNYLPLPKVTLQMLMVQRGKRYHSVQVIHRSADLVVIPRWKSSGKLETCTGAQCVQVTLSILGQMCRG